jgi:hypothetical protein
MIPIELYLIFFTSFIFLSHLQDLFSHNIPSPFNSLSFLNGHQLPASHQPKPPLPSSLPIHKTSPRLSTILNGRRNLFYCFRGPRYLYIPLGPQKHLSARGTPKPHKILLKFPFVFSKMRPRVENITLSIRLLIVSR